MHYNKGFAHTNNTKYKSCLPLAELLSSCQGGCIVTGRHLHEDPMVKSPPSPPENPLGWNRVSLGIIQFPARNDAVINGDDVAGTS